MNKLNFDYAIKNPKVIKKLFVSTLIWLLIFTSFASVIKPVRADVVWTEITLPYTITGAGNYRITAPWSGIDPVDPPLIIDASNVVVDGQNYSINVQIDESETAGVYAESRSNVLLENMNVTSAEAGINFDSCTNFTLQNCNVANTYDAGLYASDCSDFTIKDCSMTEDYYGIDAQSSNNFGIISCNISSTQDCGIIAVDSNDFHILSCNSSFTEHNNGFYALRCNNFTVSGANLNSNAWHGFSAIYSSNYTFENSNSNSNSNEGFWGGSGNNTIVQNCIMTGNNLAVYTPSLCNASFISNVFHDNGQAVLVSRSDNVSFMENNVKNNGLNEGSYYGGFQVADSNCTVSNNIFDSNYDALMWEVRDTTNNTVNIHNNVFHNNSFTFFFEYELSTSASNQKLFFNNNLVNDTGYVDPVGLSDDYSGSHLPLNSTVLNLNSTLQLGARIYSDGRLVGGNFWAHPNGTGISQTGTDANHDGFIDTVFELFGNASIGTAYDYLPYSQSYTTNLAYTFGASQILTANQTSSLVTVKLQDAYGALTSGVTFNLASNSTTGKFYSDSAATVQITSITIPAGSSTGSFYFKDTAAGTPTITVSAQGVTSATTNFTINPHAATVDHITITPQAATIVAGNAINCTTTAYDPYGNSWNVSAAYLVDGQLITGNTIGSNVAGTYIIQAYYNEKTAATTLTITPGALDRFVVQVPSSATVGSPFTMQVVAVDAVGNVVTAFTGTVTLTVSGSTISPSTSGAFTAGIWTGSVTIADTGSFAITAADGNGHTGKSSAITISTAPTPTPNPTTTTIIQATNEDGTKVNLAITGNITSSQISNIKIGTDQTSSTTTLSFTVTGPSGTSGFSNITIAKSSIPYGTAPIVYIDGQQAQNQGYTEDNQNYYVWYTTTFSMHQVQIQFTGQASVNPAQIAVYALIIALAIVAVAVALVVNRRKHKAHNQPSLL